MFKLVLWTIADLGLCRGAGSSKGSTSWQGKSELEDYISFAGLFIHYIEDVRAFDTPPHISLKTIDRKTSTKSLNSATSLSHIDPKHQGMTLILGGYSYGSLITTNLPTTDKILERFDMVSKGSAAAEIQLRATHLASQWNRDASEYREIQHARKSGSHEQLRPSAHTLAVALGGDESESGSRRSCERKRSLDAVRRSIDRSRRKLGLRHHSHSSEMSDCNTAEGGLAAAKVALPQTCYLLISPLLPPISTFATMFSGTIFHLGKSPACEVKLNHNPTLAVYGDSDFFTSQKKLRRWAEDAQAESKGQFQFREIAGAGHFWREDGSDEQMRSAIRDWIRDISTEYTSSE